MTEPLHASTAPLAAASRRRAARPLLVHATLVLLALGVALLAGEILLRRGVIDPYANYTTGLNPGVEWRNAASPQRVRILALGDSFTGGPFSYPEQMQALLQRRGGRIGYETLNLAVPGVGPRNYEGRLTSIGRRFHPNIVLVGIYVGNDVANVRHPYDPETWRNEAYYFLKAHSHMGRFLKLKSDLVARRWAAWLRPPPAVPAFSATEPDPPPNPFLIEAAREYPDFFTHGLLLNHAGFRRALQETFGILREIAAECAAMEATPVFILFPAAVQVDERYQPFYRGIGFRLAPELLTDHAVQREFTAFFSHEGMLSLDLLPAFVRERSADLYYPRDEHLTIRGRAFVAEQVLGFLEGHGLVTR